MEGNDSVPQYRRSRRQARKKKRIRCLIAVFIALGILLLMVSGTFVLLKKPGPARELAKEIFNEYFGRLRLMAGWTTHAKQAYGLMSEKRSELGDDAIAWFIETDQHGRKVPTAQWVYDKDRSVKVISLGDVATDYFNEKELMSFSKRMSAVENKICVFGNHDVWTKSSENANYANLESWFQADGKRTNSQKGFFTVIDEAYRVKYLVVSPYDIQPEAGGYGVELTIGTEQMTWLLDELSADDGYDLIVLSHQPFADRHYGRNGDMQSNADAPQILKNLWEVLKDRRNRRSGEIVDGDGMRHAYDFSAAETDILCSLHGHAHSELMCTDEGMTAYVADWLSDNYNCAFGLIDRKNARMYIWKFNQNQVYDQLTLEIE